MTNAVRIVVVDDESLARQRLIAMLADLPQCEVVGEAANGHDAINVVTNTHPDVAILDIRMPGMDGLEAARHINALDKSPAIIFATAYDDRAIEAFEANAIDYVLKPIRDERLRLAIDKARRFTGNELEQLSQDATDARGHICARVRGNLELIPIEDIHYFMADHKYVSVHHRKGEVLIEEPLKSLETEFAGRFIRIHRNSLVAIDRIAGLERDNEGHSRVKLRESDHTLEISRRNLATVRKLIKDL